MRRKEEVKSIAFDGAPSIQHRDRFAVVTRDKNGRAKTESLGCGNKLPLSYGSTCR